MRADDLLFYIRADLRNKIRRQLRRISQPRYAIALFVGLLYFFFVFGGPSLFRGDQPDISATMPLLQIVPFVLAVLAIYWWMGGGARDAIAFAPAEVNLLFTAPLSRRELIVFKLAVSQVPLLFTALFTTLFMRGLPIPFGLRLLSAWVLFATLQLHQIGAGLVHAAAMQQGRAGWRRIRIPAAVFATALLLLIVAIAGVLPELRRTAEFAERIRVLAGALDHGVGAIAVMPFRIMVDPMRAPSVAAWAYAFLAAFLTWILHLMWVLRMDTAFEEAAADAGSRVAARIEAMRAGRSVRLDSKPGRKKKLRRPFFDLPAAGAPGIAVLWKNVLYYSRNFTVALIPIVLALPVFAGVMTYIEEDLRAAFFGAGLTLLMLAGVIILLAGQIFRNDLRMDFKSIELIRTLPLNGRQLLTAEIGASVATATILQLVLAIPALLLMLASGHLENTGSALVMAWYVMLGLPAINGLSLGVQNAIALFFPAWLQVGAARPGGVESMGGHMLSMVAALLIFALLLVPPMLVSMGMLAYASAQIGQIAVVPASLSFIATMYGELVLIVFWLGAAYDRFDPVAAGLRR